MVNETVGIVESRVQSTADSPFGLGMRSHTYGFRIWGAKQKQTYWLSEGDGKLLL